MPYIVKKFKVVSVSSNTNSFGLHGVVLLAKDGEAYEVGANYINVPKKDSCVMNQVKVDENYNRVTEDFPWGGFGFEIPRRLKDAPKEVINEVWKN